MSTLEFRDSASCHFPQWLVLRRSVARAGWWVLANSLAWMLGMVVIFIGTSFIPATGVTVQVALMLLFFVIAAGAVVGAVHGLVLIWLCSKVVSGLEYLPMMSVCW